jgi:hypothetical protein
MIHEGWAICFTASGRHGGIARSFRTGRAQAWTARIVLGSSPRVNVTRLGGRWETRRGLEGLFGVSSRLGWIDTLDRRDKGSDRRKVINPLPEADEGRAKAQRSSWHTSEGERSGEHRPDQGVTLMIGNGLLAGSTL